MNPDVRNLFQQVVDAPTRTKAVVAFSVLSLLGILWLAGVVARRPHYVTLYTDLDNAERVSVERALAEGRVPYRVSQPPGPYTVFVDEGEFDNAQVVVALSEALRRAPSGINATEGGAKSIFMSSGERQQMMIKKEWQEAEKLLELLDFVNRATVTTSIPESSPLREPKPPTVSVVLKLRGGDFLTPNQTAMVARLVQFRFGVPSDNVLISDQDGRTLFDPMERNDTPDMRTLLQHAREYDEELARKVNHALAATFGEKKVLVTVTSEWDFDQSATLSEVIDGEPVVLTSEKTDSKTPQGSASSGVGGAAGTASNLAQNTPDGAGGSSTPVATLSEERTSAEVSKSRTQRVRTVPQLSRLYVSLAIDDSLSAQQAQIESVVKAAVGFDQGRKDVLGVSTVAFAKGDVDLDEDGNPIEPAGGAEAAEGPNETMELLLEKGVEIVAALGFVLILLSSLKGSKKKAKKGGVEVDENGEPLAGSRPGEESGEEFQPDPEELARLQIEELVKTDPRRVGEILTRWAEDGVGATR